MFKNILNTLFTKFFMALVGFGVIVLISHLLGTHGKGEQAIVVFNINIILMALTLVGSSTLIYLTPRKNFSQMFFPCIVWIICLSIVAIFAIEIIPFLNNKYALQTVGISMLASITEINYYVLMGKQQVIKANNLRLIYPLTNAMLILIMWLLGVFTDIQMYIYSLWAAYFFSLVYGVWILRDEYRGLKMLSKHAFKAMMKEMFGLGFIKQIGSIAQTMNYRVALWILVWLFGSRGMSMSGIYSNATTICEAVLLFGTSLALVQYSSLSNTQSNQEAKNLTIKLTKVNVLVTGVSLLVICLLPRSLWAILFGQGFEDVGYYIRLLAIGYMFLSASSNVTQYFASRGNFSITASASIVGLVITGVMCFLLVPKYEIKGVAIAAVCSYVVGFLIEFLYFLKWIKRQD